MKIAEKIWEPVRRAGRADAGDGNEACGTASARPPRCRRFCRRLGRGRSCCRRRHRRRCAALPRRRLRARRSTRIKDRVAGMNWRIQPRRGRVLDEEMQERIQVLTETLEQPNPDDSLPFVCGAGSGGHHRGRIWRDRAAADRGRAEAAGAVSGGRGDDPDAGGLEWRAELASLCAGDGRWWDPRAGSS